MKRSAFFILCYVCFVPGTSRVAGEDFSHHFQKRSINTGLSEKSIVVFKNISNFSSPGFMRLPLIAASVEGGIFVSNRMGDKFKEVYLDEEVELFYSGDTYVPYVLKNNDSIVIQNSKSPDITLPYILKSADSIRSNEIRFFEEAVNKRIPLLYWEQGNIIKGFVTKSELENNLPALTQLLSQANLFVQTYTTENKVSKEFDAFLRDYVRFNHYIKVLMYIGRTSLIDSLISADYFDLNRAESNIYDNANEAYLGTLYQLLQHHIRKKKNITLDSVFYACDDLFDSKNAALVKYQFIRNKFDSLFLKNAKDLIQKISTIEEPAYKNVLEQKVLNFNMLASSKNLIIDVTGNTYTLKEIIALSRKSLIYIDFWASWCVPCREEFVNYPALRQQFDSSKIDYFFVSIDKSKIAWERTSLQEKLDSEAFNFLYVAPSVNELKRLGLGTIPRYHLYHNGVLVDNNAPRPGDPRLIPLLRMYSAK